MATGTVKAPPSGHLRGQAFFDIRSGETPEVLGHLLDAQLLGNRCELSPIFAVMRLILFDHRGPILLRAVRVVQGRFVL